MKRLPFYHTFGGKANVPSIALAERLIAMAPVPMSKVFFANSGSEANDTAIKLVWYYHNAIGKPDKKKIISRIRAYHGVTVATASLTGLPYSHRDFDLPIARVLHTDCPGLYRLAQPGETEETFATRCADTLEQLILREGPDTIGAFFAEPLMASGGCIVPPATYYDKIQARAAPLRHLARSRRSDLRLRAPWDHVRQRELRDEAGHDRHGQAAVRRLPADLGPDDQR